MLSQPKDLTSGALLWPDLSHPSVPVDRLTSDMTTDVVVIGAGVTGALTAQALAAAGLNVVVLDRRPLLKGSTTATTALIQFELDTPLTLLEGEIGREKAARAWQRSKLAVDGLAAKIQALAIDCDMTRTPSIYLAGNVLTATPLAEEGRRRHAIGLHSDYLDAGVVRETYGIKRRAALRSQDNLTLNPLKLAAGFLLKAREAGARIFAPVTVDDITSKAGKVIVTTSGGPTLTAGHVVHATGYEIPKALNRRKFDLQSTYAIATRPQPDALWPGPCLIWEASDPYLYLRATPDGRVICGGEDEVFEDEGRRDALIPAKTKALERRLKAMFPDLNSRADYAWAGTFGVTKTSLPMIGALPGMTNGYGILAFGGNGITFGALAADMITTLMTGGIDPDAELFGFG